jgi:hypothetical protein
MRSFRLQIPLAALVLFAVIALNACKKDDDTKPVDTTDRDLFNLARDTASTKWFGNSAAIRPRSSLSGHGEAFLRTRYNAAAAAQLDPATGRVRPGAVFGAGSIVVKELHQTATSGATLLAVIQKTTTSNTANGWAWAEFSPSGAVVVSTAQKGAGCVSCHSQTGNIDATLMNKFFP